MAPNGVPTEPPGAYAVGGLIAGRYRVIRHVRGGIGEVYFCRDERTGTALAIKTPQDSRLMKPERRQRRLRRFKAEAAIWATLEDHPNVVRCHYLSADGDRPLLFMEWVVAEDRPSAGLGRFIQLRGRIPPAEALAIAIGACRGLLHLQKHHQGFVHRDLKPENILIGPDGTPKVTDFGYSLLRGLGLKAAAAAVSDSSIVGTPPYMAPEQWRTGLVDDRADVYALGLILFEMVEGRRPFSASDRKSWSEAHRLGTPVPMSEWVAEPLKSLVGRCLAKDPNGRPSGVAVLLEELSRVYLEAAGEPIPPSMVAPGASPSALINRGNSMYHLGMFEEALRAYDAALIEEPLLAQALAGRGLVLQALGEAREALDAYESALQADPAYAWAHANRAALLQSLGQTADAIEGSSRAIALAPGMAVAWLNRGLARLSVGDRAGALQDLSAAVERDGPREAFATRARLLAEDGGFAAAVAVLERLRDREQLTAEEEQLLGSCLCEVGRQRDAVAAFTRALSLGGPAAELHRLRGTAYARALRPRDALEDCSIAVRLAPANPDGFRLRAAVYLDLGRPDDALSDYAQAIALNEDDPLSYYEVALLLGQRGEVEKANHFLEAAIRLGSLEAQQAKAALESRVRALTPVAITGRRPA